MRGRTVRLVTRLLAIPFIFVFVASIPISGPVIPVAAISISISGPVVSVASVFSVAIVSITQDNSIKPVGECVHPGVMCLIAKTRVTYCPVGHKRRNVKRVINEQEPRASGVARGGITFTYVKYPNDLRVLHRVDLCRSHHFLPEGRVVEGATFVAAQAKSNQRQFVANDGFTPKYW